MTQQAVSTRDGLTLSLQNVPGTRLLHDAGTTATNPTSATTLLAGGAASNLWPTYVNAGDCVRVSATGSFNMHTSAQVTWTVLMGATTVATLGPNTATVSTARRWALDLWFEFVSSTSVKPTGYGWLRTPTATGFQSPTAIADLWFGDGTAVTVSAAPQTFDLKALISASDAASVVVCDAANVWHYPA